MAQKVYGRRTQNHPEAGGINWDFDVLAGTPQGFAITETGTSFVVKARFFCTVGPSGDFPLPLNGAQDFDISLNLSTLVNNQAVRCRIERWITIGGMQASGDYSASFTTQGVHTDTIAIDTTWSDGDYLVLAVEVRQQSAGGTPECNLSFNDADTFAEYPIDSGGVRNKILMPMMMQ